MKKLIFFFTILLGGFFYSSTFGVYLTSGNIVSVGAGGCNTGGAICVLSNKSITGIATDAFINYPNKRTVYLDNNQITSIESGDFNGLSNLQTLYLNYNEITTIENGGFNGISFLWNLYLDNNQITSIENGDFNGLSALQNLYLPFNQITTIASGGFNGLSSLQTLYLNNNQITSIESGNFNGLSSLQTLYLPFNQITSIENGDFNGLSALTILTLNSNLITSIEPGGFSGLSTLTTLNLNSNQIASIRNGSFNELTNLTTLDFGSNLITIIESGALSGVPVITDITRNCIDTGTVSQSDTDILDTLQPGRQDYGQFVCVVISYDPTTNTSGSVTGTLVFTGGNPDKRATVIADNSGFSSIHIWTGNYAYGFDLSQISDDNIYLLNNDAGYYILTGRVTWIEVPATGGSGLSCLGSCAFISRPNVGPNFDYGVFRKPNIVPGTIYPFTLSFTNTSGNPVTQVTLPGGFILPVAPIAPGASSQINLNIKYFVQ